MKPEPAMNSFPAFDACLPELNQFIFGLSDAYRSGHITSWDELELSVQGFFTPERMADMEKLVPGWQKMASFREGVTLTHVLCVFLGLVLLPEYEELAPYQQQLAKWIVLFHDLEKEIIPGQRDYTHGFRSAARAAHILPALGFHAPASPEQVADWAGLAESAKIKDPSHSDFIQDNSRLPTILTGLEHMYGVNTAETLIVKGALLHMSVNVVKAWPQAAPLADAELKQYIDAEFLPLLCAMCLADNEGWVMFEPEVRGLQRNDTLEAFQAITRLITR